MSLEGAGKTKKPLQTPILMIHHYREIRRPRRTLTPARHLLQLGMADHNIPRRGNPLAETKHTTEGPRGAA